MESDFYEDEIFYYKHRFPEEGIDIHLLTRLWGQERLTFHGHEYRAPFEVERIVRGHVRRGASVVCRDHRPLGHGVRPAALHGGRHQAPAGHRVPRAGRSPRRTIVKGIICHGMWLVAPLPELVRGRPVVAHNNLHGDVVNMGAIYTDQDVVIDGDLVTGRTGGHRHLFARAIIDAIAAKDGAARSGSGAG